MTPRERLAGRFRTQPRFRTAAAIPNPCPAARSISLFRRETSLPNHARELDPCFQTIGKLSTQLCRAIPGFPCFRDYPYCAVFSLVWYRLHVAYLIPILIQICLYLGTFVRGMVINNEVNPVFGSRKPCRTHRNLKITKTQETKRLNGSSERGLKRIQSSREESGIYCRLSEI